MIDSKVDWGLNPSDKALACLPFYLFVHVDRHIYLCHPSVMVIDEDLFIFEVLTEAINILVLHFVRNANLLRVSEMKWLIYDCGDIRRSTSLSWS